MRKIYFILLVGLIPLFSLGQSAYFLTDSSAYYGIKLMDKGSVINSKLCQRKKGKKIIEYTPYELKEYGFKDGRVFISREVQIADSSKRVFLERLIEGETTLFYYREKGLKTFFIEKDSTLFVEVPKKIDTQKDYSERLLKLTDDCAETADACKLLSYNKRSFSELFTRYNKCRLQPFPHFTYGPLIGYELSKLIPNVERNENLAYFNYDYDGGFSVGVFLNHPIFVSDFSLHTEFVFSEHKYSYNIIIENKDIDLVAEFYSFKVPMLLRYTVPLNTIRPFVNFGGVFTYHFNNKIELYEANIEGSNIEISNINESFVHEYQGGYNLGVGVQYPLNYKKSVFLEFRYNKLYGMSNSESFDAEVIEILTGINF